MKHSVSNGGSPTDDFPDYLVKFYDDTCAHYTERSRWRKVRTPRDQPERGVTVSNFRLTIVFLEFAFLLIRRARNALLEL